MAFFFSKFYLASDVMPASHHLDIKDGHVLYKALENASTYRDVEMDLTL